MTKSATKISWMSDEKLWTVYRKDMDRWTAWCQFDDYERAQGYAKRLSSVRWDGRLKESPDLVKIELKPARPRRMIERKRGGPRYVGLPIERGPKTQK